jgi:pimeloyl-ACP methyl ester carboxylesterase
MAVGAMVRGQVLLGVAGLALAAGCGSDAPARNARASKVPADAPITAECPEEVVPDDAERITVLGEDGTAIGGAVFGQGDTAVILVHGSGQDLCDWMSFVPKVAGLGVTVVPYDLRGRGTSGGSRTDVDPLPGDLAAVVDAVRERGAERVVLVGTSLGAATALVSAGDIQPAVDAVVAVSPPLALGGAKVLDRLASFPGPVFLLATDGDEIFARNVETLSAAFPEITDAQVIDGSQHGMRLVAERPDDVMAVIHQAVDAAEGA